MRASIMLIWHSGHIGRWMVIELALIRAGARNSQSPVDAVGRGDAPSLSNACCCRWPILIIFRTSVGYPKHALSRFDSFLEYAVVRSLP